jgi:deferrochelatase/peroxidase EfeB
LLRREFVEQAPGVMPDDISRDPQADSWLIFIDLANGSDVQAWLKDTVTPAVKALTSPPPQGDKPVAVCTVGFGTAIFDKANRPDQRPPGLVTALPPEIPPDSHDVCFYVFSLSDAVVADFLRSVASGSSVQHVQIERGYQRANRREVFGQLDGLRNVVPKTDRARVAFIDDDQPDVPSWAVGGSYMAYLKIKQDVAAWQQFNADQKAPIIGRRDDGSRLDLTPGTDPEAEGALVDGTAPPSPNSHVRKAGPRRNDAEDSVRIFRRGTPFIECENDVLAEGLQFVSYQASVDDFLTILQRWMLNENFPATGVGRDALFAVSNPLATFVKGGLYFAVPEDERFIGAGLFEPADSNHGILQIRLAVVDQSGQPDPSASLEDATFQITDSGGAQLATESSTAAGHATATGLPISVPLTVTQTAPPAGAALPSPAAQTVTLESCKPGIVRFSDPRSGAPGGYGA